MRSAALIVLALTVAAADRVVGQGPPPRVPRPNTAVVTGRILSQSGLPMQRAFVQLFVRQHAGYPEVTTLGPFAATDTAGVYRISDIPPGRYFVCVPASSWSKSSNADEYSTVFYPDARSAASATEFALTANELRENVNFTLAPSKVYKVSGALLGLSQRGPRGVGADGLAVQIHLIPADSPDTPQRLGEAEAWSTGAFFSINGVRSGRYLLRVADFPMRGILAGIQTNVLVGAPASGRPLQPAPSDPTLWTETMVEVGDHDLEHVNVELKTGARVSGIVRFEGGTPPDPQRFLGTAVALQWADDRDFGDSPIVRIEADGRFTTVGMPAGRYTINLYPMMKDSIPLPPRFFGPDAWKVGSIRVGDREVPHGEIEIGTTDIRNVTITLSPDK